MKCEHCNTEMIGRKRRFCDATCRRRADGNKRRVSTECTVCRKLFNCRSRKQKLCSAACRGADRRKDRVYQCECCGKQFPHVRGTKRYHKYCSRECSFVVKKITAAIRRIHEEYVLSRKCGCCVECGCSLRKANQKLCSIECRKASYRKAALQPIRQRGCVDCGGTCCKPVRNYSPYCGECRDRRHQAAKKNQRSHRRKAKALRRARMRGVRCERFNPHDVFIRDNWACGVCGKKCSMTATVPHPRAATLDHIVPLAKGGSHTMKNTQCCHFVCNSLKSDGMGAQMRLFG